jgi:hypothetical protein
MSDPVNAYPAAGQNQQQVYGQPQQAYGQPQQAYGQPAYALSPEIEKLRSNASTARVLSFVSFLFGGLLLAGGMWFWTNNMAEQAKILGAPMDVMADVESARLAAKICSIIHIVIVVLVMLLVIGSIVLAAAAGGSRY